jgi:hypothetical protein
LQKLLKDLNCDKNILSIEKRGKWMKPAHRIVGYVLSEWSRNFVSMATAKTVHSTVPLQRRFGYVLEWPLYMYCLPGGVIYLEAVQLTFTTEYIDACGFAWEEDHPIICLFDAEGNVVPQSSWSNDMTDEDGEIILTMPYPS